jgi:polar amino acid transport system permease protein
MTALIDPAYAMQILPALLIGLRRTLQATLFGAALALPLGFLLFLATGARPSLRRPAHFALQFIRSTPLLVQLYFAYFALPNLGIDLSPIAAGSIVLGVHYACYTAEVFRSARRSVPDSQHQAATALGLKPRLVLQLVILPQMLPVLLPGLGNLAIALFKETPALSAITVAELLFTARIVGAENFRYLEPMTLCGAIYLIVSLALAGLVARLEAWLHR